MPLDSRANLTYTGGGSQRTPQTDHVASANEAGEEPRIVFLSCPKRNPKWEKVAARLRERGLTVLTNFDRTDAMDAVRKTDLRLSRIRRCETFVFFAGEGSDWSPLRQIEFGYALGCEIPVAYVGKPLNSLHRYGDVFDGVDDFLDWFYSAEYNELMAQWLPDRAREAAVA